MRKDKISPEEYSRILSSLSIQDITLKKSSLEMYETESKGGSIDIKFSDKYSFTQGDETASFTSSFKMEGELVSGDVHEKVFSISADFKVFYFKTRQVEITEDFMRIFKGTSLPHVVWPFFREFILSMTSRMGLPHFTLPARYFNMNNKDNSK